MLPSEQKEKRTRSKVVLAKRVGLSLFVGAVEEEDCIDERREKKKKKRGNSSLLLLSTSFTSHFISWLLLGGAGAS
jgi:hypothetical protein